MNRAIFLDRDGVIIKEKGYITSLEQVEIYPFTVKAINRLKEYGWKTVVITNQSVVGRGFMTEENLNIIHHHLLMKCGVDAIYYCPHCPPDDESNSSSRCECRKPLPGLILRAAIEHDIDLNKSFMVGDRDSDIIAGINAGLRTVLVRTGYGSDRADSSITADYIFNDLEQFVKWLIVSGFGI